MSTKTITRFFLLILTTIIAVFFWLSWVGHLGLSADLKAYWLPVLSLILLTASFNIALVISHQNASLFLCLVSALPIFLLGSPLAFSLAAVLVFCLGLLWVFTQFRRNLTVYKKINFGRIWLSRDILWVLCLSLTILVVGRSQAEDQRFNFRIPNDLYQKVTAIVLANLTNPETNLSAGSLAARAFEKEIPNLRGELIKRGVTDPQVINSQIEAARKNYLSQVEQSLKTASPDSFDDQLRTTKETVENQINDWLERYQDYLPYLVGFSFFFSLTFFISLFVFLANLLSLIFVKFLLLTKVFTINRREEEVEYLEV